MPRVRAVLTYLDKRLRDVMKPKTSAILEVDVYKGVVVHREDHPDIEAPTGQIRLPLVGVVTGNEAMAQRVAMNARP